MKKSKESKGREDFESVALQSVALHFQAVTLKKVLKISRMLLMVFLSSSPVKITKTKSLSS